MNRQWISRSEEETESIGREIASIVGDDAVVHLIGDLGAGKTTLVRSIATTLGADPLEVTSPSFAIIHEYPRDRGRTIIHIDGYRLSDSFHEWDEIGVPDILKHGGLVFIEWPKRDFSRFGERNFEIRVEVADDDSRRISLAD